MLILAMMALALSACRVDATLDLALDRAGGGTATIHILTDDDFEEAAALTGTTFAAYVAGRAAAVPGLKLSIRPEDGRTSYTATFSAPTSDELEAALAGLGMGLEDLRVDEGDQALGFSGQTAPLASSGELAAVFEGFDPAEFSDNVGAELVVRLPGSVTYHNGTLREDGALVWILPFDHGSTIGARATWVRSFPFGLVLLVGALAGGGWFLNSVRRSSRAQGGDPVTAEPEPAVAPVAAD